jgi:hypothetical protein
MSILNQLIEYLPLKPSSVGNPNKYLGSKLKKTRLDNKLEAWEMSPSKYVTWAAKNCASHLTKKIARKYPVPECTYNLFSTDYCATTNITEPLTPEYASFFMHLISVLHWMVELGQVDIVTEVSLLLLYLAYPQEGQLESALHIMGYVKQKHNTRLVFYPTYPDIDHRAFLKYKWSEFYGDVQEAIPADAKTA